MVNEMDSSFFPCFTGKKYKYLKKITDSQASFSAHFVDSRKPVENCLKWQIQGLMFSRIFTQGLPWANRVEHEKESIGKVLL